jgi:hypothetical protein
MAIGNFSRALIALCVVSVLAAWSQSEPKRLTEEDEWRDANRLMTAVHSVKPSSGFVADAKTAQHIAEAVAAPLYGEEEAHKERPYRARLQGNVWTVLGTHNPPLALGGDTIIQISKIDGRIIFAHHKE